VPPQANKRWKGLELRLSDAANEAKDNVRYLATLDQPFEVLKSGSPQQVLDSLHTLLQSITTLYKIARYYGTPQRMTTLFSKITNQMIRLCKGSVLAPGKLWDQDKPSLVANMQVGC
jgi:dynein heavy chain